MSIGNVFAGCTVSGNGAPAGFLYGSESGGALVPLMLDEEIITRDWPRPAPQEPEKSLWARIWDAVREPFGFEL